MSSVFHNWFPIVLKHVIVHKQEMIFVCNIFLIFISNLVSDRATKKQVIKDLHGELYWEIWTRSIQYYCVIRFKNNSKFYRMSSLALLYPTHFGVFEKHYTQRNRNFTNYKDSHSRVLIRKNLNNDFSNDGSITWQLSHRKASANSNFVMDTIT